MIIIKDYPWKHNEKSLKVYKKLEEKLILILF